MMDIQKQRELFEEKMCHKLVGDFNAMNNRYNELTDQLMWEAWQAAKADAVPDGFKIVSFKQISELVVAVNKVDLMTHTEQKTNEVRLAWQDIASKLQTMIEAAQEQNQ